MLFGLELLPGHVRSESQTPHFSTWCLAAGSFVAILAFILWRPQQCIFFDRICLHQKDQEQVK